MATNKRNYAEHNLKYAKPATRRKFEESRTKFYEAQFYAKDNPTSAAAKKALERATAKMSALGEITYDESQKRKVGRNTTMGTTIARKAAGINTKTVNKINRPVGY